MQHFVVTGGCGFIGSHLVDALVASGESVVVFDNLSTGDRRNVAERAEVIVGDIADRGALRRAMNGAKGVFHMAAVASVQRCTDVWLDSHLVNQGGTVAVFEAARDVGRIPVVYASSAAVYGDSLQLPLREFDLPLPQTSYAADKWACEIHAGVAGRIHDVPTFGLRFFNVFGARQVPNSAYSGVISIFLERMMRDDAISIHGDGGQSRDFVYVADVVEHVIAAMRFADTAAPVVNVCSGRSTSVLELFQILRELTGYKRRPLYIAARPGDVRVSVGDPTLAIETLGCRTRTSLRNGLTSLRACWRF